MARTRPLAGIGLVCIGALVAFGCGGSSSSDDPDAAVGGVDSAVGGADSMPQPHTLTQIVVTPTNTILEVDLNTPASQAFTATGKYLDGVDEDLTSQVTWTVANPTVGTMTAATLDVPGFATATAEVSLVTATLDTISGDGQITVVAYQQTGPQQDFFFVLPYQDPAGNQDKPLDFGTDVPAADVFFLMDTTGSMGEEIGNLQSALTGTVIPGIQAEIADTQFGAGAAEDFPVDGYGSTNAGASCPGALSASDQPFELFQEITSNIASITSAVGSFSAPGGAPIGCGEDWPESNIEALYQVATGQGLSGPGGTSVAANSSGIGGVGFRQGTMPIVVQFTDAMSHAPGEMINCPEGLFNNNYLGAVAGVAHTRQETKDALNNICARVVGIAPILPGGVTPACLGQPDLEDFATATNARVPPQAWDVPARPAGCAAGQCCTDFNGTGRAPDVDGLCPLVFRVDDAGTGLGTHVVTGMKMLTRFATFDVTTEKMGETASTTGVPLATGTTADFIKNITPVSFTLPPPPPNLPDPTFDATSFQNVTPGTVVNFDVTAFNDFVEPTNEPQIFRATIRVLAGGCTELDEREVLILVPPNPIVVD